MSTARTVGRSRSFFARAATVYGAATALVVIAWAVVVDAWWLQPLNLTTFWWSLPAVAFLPIALWRRRRLAALALAVPAGLWLWTYGGLFLPSSPPPARAELRVATYNTYVGIEGIGHIEHLVAETQPDVLVLQEVFPDREQQLRARFAEEYPNVLAVQSPGVGGVMVLSRYPISEVIDVGESDDHSRATSVAMLDVDGTPVQIVPIHLTSPCPTCGSDVSERLDTEGLRRQAEVSAVLRALRPGVPVVVAGDFNSNERSGPYRRFTRAGFHDPHRARGSGPGFTWPNDASFGPFIRVDWILTRQLTPVEAWVDDGSGSDHRPVVVDLALPGG